MIHIVDVMASGSLNNITKAIQKHNHDCNIVWQVIDVPDSDGITYLECELREEATIYSDVKPQQAPINH